MVWDVGCWWVGRARIPRAGCGRGLDVVVLDIDFESDADDFFACLSKECAFLALKVATCGTRAHLGKVVGRGGGEHGHQVVA